MPAYADVQQLEPGQLVDLFLLDTTMLAGDVRRMHGYTQVGPIIWQGQAFEPWPIQATGFELNSDGRPPAPVVTVANIGGMLGALARALDDLVGARFTRLRTFGRYLDAANFPAGNPTADPAEQLRPEVWYIEQRSRETSELVEFTLASPLNLNGAMLPGRQILANVCGWLKHGGYRGPYCNYTGSACFDARDQPVADPSLDQCGGRLESCRLRFESIGQPLNFGGMPAADGLR